MGGVDLADMLMELYRIDVRSRKYYMRIVYYCIDLCLVNAWLFYRRHCFQKNVKKPMSLLDFRMNVADALMGANKNAEKRPGRPLSYIPVKKGKAIQGPPCNEIRRDGIGHWPIFDTKRKRCQKCPGVGTLTFVKCTKCNVNLCFQKGRNFFYQFHM